jgi:hypothetical protein
MYNLNYYALFTEEEKRGDQEIINIYEIQIKIIKTKKLK